MNGDPREDPERRHAGNKFGSGGPWTTDHTPITEFNGPEASEIFEDDGKPTISEEMYSILRQDGDFSEAEKKELEKRVRDLRDLIGSEHDKPDWIKEEVNHPPHYNNRRMEAIDIIELIIEIEPNTKVAYNISNVLKYILRFRDKGNPVKDLTKAKWYLDRAILNLEREEEENV